MFLHYRIERYSSITASPSLIRQPTVSAVLDSMSNPHKLSSVSSKAATGQQMDGSQNVHNQNYPSIRLPSPALTSNINSQIQNLSLGSTPQTDTAGSPSTPSVMMPLSSTASAAAAAASAVAMQPSIVSPEFGTSALSTTEDLPEQRIFPGIVHERIRKERCGEESDDVAGGGAGDMKSGSVAGKEPVWNLDGMDDE